MRAIMFIYFTCAFKKFSTVTSKLRSILKFDNLNIIKDSWPNFKLTIESVPILSASVLQG